jgi:hypothetical protein
LGFAIDKKVGRQVLAEAARLAVSGDQLPEDWIRIAEEIGRVPVRTYPVALATGLLARATDIRADALALKVVDDPGSYSARNLAHGVLVPGSVEYEFDLGATGREPLNNQPFFRYDRIDGMERVRTTAQFAHSQLVANLTRANTLTANEALAALAAFIRVRQAVTRRKQGLRLVDPSQFAAGEVIRLATEFVGEASEGGRRAQAVVAAAFEMIYDEVRSERVNSPSSHIPGDVAGIVDGFPALVAEVRTKPCTETDVLLFVRATAEAGIDRALMVALAQSASPLSRESLIESANRRWNIHLGIAESIEELLSQSFLWSTPRLAEVEARLPIAVSQRLEEIDANDEGRERWKQLFSKTRSR